MFTIDLETSTAQAIRARIAETQRLIAEAADGEHVASAAVDDARAAKGLAGNTPTTRSELIRAQRALNEANGRRLDLEAALRRLEKGLVAAQQRDTSAAERKWRPVAAKARAEIAADGERAHQVLDNLTASLEALDIQLKARQTEVRRIEGEAAAEGVSLGLNPLSPLGDRGYRYVKALRSAIDGLRDYLPRQR